MTRFYGTFPVWPLTIRLPSKQAFFGLCAPECAPGVAFRETRGTALKAGWSGEYTRRCGRFEWEGREPARAAGVGGTQPAGGAHSGAHLLHHPQVVGAGASGEGGDQGNGEEGGAVHAVIVPPPAVPNRRPGLSAGRRGPGERREPSILGTGNGRRFACHPTGARLRSPFPQPAAPRPGFGSAAVGR